jgi:cytochrome d ubiquinol oxidase subunit I
MVWAVALPYLANTTGWLFTEIARQPWIVFGLQKTADAMSPAVSTGMVLFSLVGFTVLYGVLMAADLYLLLKFAKSGPGPAQPEPVEAPAGTPASAYLK